MSDYGLFWNSRGGDRLYNADSMEEWLKPFFVTGVFNGHLQVTATSGMGISVSSGYCNINGKVRFFDDATTFTLDAASGTGTRVDTVVIERNNGEREITLKVIKGASDTPTPPVREGGIYQLVLAQITVGRGVTSITQSDITDTRTSSELCGYVVATVDEINFDQIVSQFTSWFDEYKAHIISTFEEEGEIAQEIFNSWFEHVKGQLSTDVAGHLQLEIEAIEAMLGSVEFGSVATHAHPIGSYLIYDEAYYMATSNISIGDTLAVGTNIKSTTIGNVLAVIKGESGLLSGTTVFNVDGSITQTFTNGNVKNVVFNQDGSITEVLKNSSNITIYSKTTTFNADGSITEEVI